MYWLKARLHRGRMVNIKNLFVELKYEIFKNILLVTFLRTVIVFFIFDILASLIDLWYVFSVIFAAVYFITRLIKQMNKINMKVFEDNNPEIREMLTTAADNVNKDNIVVDHLFKDVIHKVRRLSSGSLIIPQAVLIMILIIPVLAVVDYELNPLRIDALSQDAIIDGFQKVGYIKGFFNKTDVRGDIIEDEFLDEDIYGDRKIAQLGDQEINIKMNLGFETDLTRPKDEDTDQILFKDYPDEGDVEIVYDTNVLQEHIEESDLARKYNEKIRNFG